MSVFLLNVLASLYLVIALLAMTHTIREYRESGYATLLGALAGCLVCLAWLPAFLGMVAWQAWFRASLIRRGLRPAEIRA